MASSDSSKYVLGAVAGAAAAVCVGSFLQGKGFLERDLCEDAAPRRGVASVIDGKAIAGAIRGEIKAAVENMVATQGGSKPGLAVVLVGERKDSATYVRMKKKAAAEVGFHSVDVNLAATASEREIVEAVVRLNEDPKIHGILVQLPLPKHVDEAKVLRCIRVDKDADGFAALNVGHLCLRGGEDPSAVACTPAGCVELLTRSGVDVKGKAAVVVGRSNIVGMPVAALLQKMDATVTVCHSRTRDIKAVVRGADIVVAAIGKPEFIKGDWLKPGCVVVDVGINAVDDKNAKRGYRLVGDVDYAAAVKVCSKITPVPGGVGPMTIAMLLRNTLRLAERHASKTEDVGFSRTTSTNDLSRDDAFGAPENSKKGTVSPAPTDAAVRRVSPVPKDIEISQMCTPLPMAYVAERAGLVGDELVPWGRHKAKVDFAKAHARLANEPDGSLVVVRAGKG